MTVDLALGVEAATGLLGEGGGEAVSRAKVMATALGTTIGERISAWRDGQRARSSCGAMVLMAAPPREREGDKSDATGTKFRYGVLAFLLDAGVQPTVMRDSAVYGVSSLGNN